MNRSLYFNYIEQKLTHLAVSIKERGKLNILDFNIHAENFFMHFFNLIYDLALENLNASFQNAEAIDLIDNESKIIIQVSATNTKQKIEASLNKESIRDHNTYQFKFICIAHDASELRTKQYRNPYGINFNPQNDIFDLSSLLHRILVLDIEKLKSLYLFIRDELSTEIDYLKLDSNLATIVNILAQNSLDDGDDSSEINSFEIDRKIEFNELSFTRMLIEDFKIYYSRLNAAYQEFDKMGCNKSLSVLQTIRRQYIQICSRDNSISSDEKFLTIIENVKKIIIESANYIEIPVDELYICVNIVVVDAFIKCKIFRNPKDYQYAFT